MNEYAENYTFDSYHRPASVTRWLASDPAKSYTTGFAYNGGSQITQMTYPSGSVINASYDPAAGG